jgi:hypothetical protein
MQISTSRFVDVSDGSLRKINFFERLEEFADKWTICQDERPRIDNPVRAIPRDGKYFRNFRVEQRVTDERVIALIIT